MVHFLMFQNFESQFFYFIYFFCGGGGGGGGDGGRKMNSLGMCIFVDLFCHLKNWTSLWDRFYEFYDLFLRSRMGIVFWD